ncbi:hypothetical protein [Sphingomonas echinoides]|uniref:hypothetical protein n=1 Tax=Sphingomonas echinoides TaxID=59803 RepID=UPI002412F440|nr:hypothetical protein [Sphingomonas echinoides]
MPLNALSLTGTLGTIGRPFSAGIVGLTAGSTLEVLPDCTPGLDVVNGRVSFGKLSRPANNVALRESLSGVGVRETRIAVSGLAFQLMPDSWDFSSRIKPGQVIATFGDPFLGTFENLDAPTSWSTVGTVPPQLALVGPGVIPGAATAIIAGAAAPVAGTTYSISVRATSGAGGGATATFLSLKPPPPLAGTIVATLPLVCI